MELPGPSGGVGSGWWGLWWLFVGGGNEQESAIAKCGVSLIGQMRVASPEGDLPMVLCKIVQLEQDLSEIATLPF